MQQTNIAIVTHEFPPKRGGAGVYCEEIAYASKSLGIDCEVWAPRNSIESELYKVRALPLKGSQDWICSWKLIKYLKKNAHKCKYLHLADPGALRAVMRFGWLLQDLPTLIVTIHGSELLRFTQIPLEKHLLRQLLSKAKRIHVLSTYNANVLAELYPEIRSKILTIPGAPARKIIPQKTDKKNQRTPKGSSPFTLLCVGRIHPRKGQLELLQAIAKLTVETKQKLICKIVGPVVNKSYYKTLKEVSDTCGCLVKFTGDQSDEELKRHYKEADIFALTSMPHPKSVEGFGFVYLEASAHGLPIIAHKTGGVEDAVQDGVTGFLIEPENITELTKKIDLLINDEEMISKIGINGEMWAIQHNWSKVVNALYTDF
jgi:glycosyltransferase involved in cell wall biosynthesis